MCDTSCAYGTGKKQRLQASDRTILAQNWLQAVSFFLGTSKKKMKRSAIKKSFDEYTFYGYFKEFPLKISFIVSFFEKFVKKNS
jgi:hypothetical protein